MADDPASDKTGPRRYCAPHDGSRSPDFLPFEQNFRVGAMAHFLPEDDYSIWSAIDDTHQGGQANGAPQMPAPGAAGHAKAMRLFNKRIAVAFQMIYIHIDDTHMRATMMAIPDDDRRARLAWEYVLACCAEGTSDLDVQRLEQQFANATIENTVGHCVDSIIKFAKHIDGIDARMPAGRPSALSPSG
jgi:hypothetical protein